MQKIIQEVKDAVKEWQTIANSVEIRGKTISLINTEIESNYVNSKLADLLDCFKNNNMTK